MTGNHRQLWIMDVSINKTRHQVRRPMIHDLGLGIATNQLGPVAHRLDHTLIDQEAAPGGVGQLILIIKSNAVAQQQLHSGS